MARDTEQLVVQLSADMRQFQREMVRAAGEAERAAQRIERGFAQRNARAIAQFQDFGAQVRTIFATIGVGLVVRDVVELGDAWTRVGNALASAGIEADQLAATQENVADIALRSRSDLEATADLYARMLRSSQDLGASMGDVARATEIVGKALAGASQSERAGAIRQLGQALGAGVLAGDELRSILENSRVLAQAIADEFGVGVGQLRELGKQGVLESRRVFEAILRAGDQIEASFARTTATVADSFVNLRTQITRYVGTTEATSSANRALAGSIQFVAENFEALADAIIVVATVLGGALAGQAIARAITGLAALSTSAITARAALAFLGGPLGIALTAAGVAFALLATKTDLFASSAQRARTASESLAVALQSQSEETIEAAIADQQAIIAAQRRASILRQIQALLTLQPVTPEVSGPTVEEEAVLARAEGEILRLEARLARIRAGVTERTPDTPPAPADDAADARAAAARAAADDAARETRERERQLHLTELEAEIERAERADLRRLEQEAELARLSGDQQAAEAAERRLAIERRIADLRSLGFDDAEARRRAEEEQAAQEAAALQGRFREAFRASFSDGVMAALEGDLGEFFENWIHEAAASGLRKALDSVADVIFSLFAQAMQSATAGSGGGSFWSMLGNAFFSAATGTTGVKGVKPFGGAKAGGGAVSPSSWYTVGEHGPEAFVPTQPGVVIPNGALASSMTVDASDRRTIHFVGTSEELAQLRAVMQEDFATRRQQVVGVVETALSRRHLGRT